MFLINRNRIFPVTRNGKVNLYMPQEKNIKVMINQYGKGRGAILSSVVNNVGDEKIKASQLITPEQFTASSEQTDMGGESNINTFSCDSKCSDIENEICASNSQEEDTLSLMTTPQKSAENQEDINWQIYKFERKIKSLLKDVTDKSLGVVYKQLQEILEDRPLSSRFTDCSEVEQLLKVFFEKSINDANFLPYAACFIKLVHRNCSNEFTKYFKEIIILKGKEVAQNTASSGAHLPSAASNFCQLLGKLMCMPRQVDSSFFDELCPVVDEFIENWTFPEKTEENLDGFNLSLALVKAEAACKIIQEISVQMITSDSVLTEKMETYIWYLRESFLNSHIPRALKEIYLDGFMAVQTSSIEHNTDSQKIGYYATLSGKYETAASLLEEDPDYVYDHVPDNNSPEMVTCMDANGMENKIISDDEEDVVIESEEIIAGNENGNLENENALTVVKYLLKELDMEELLEKFQEHHIQDSILMTASPDELRLKMKEADIPRMVCFNIEKIIKNKGFENLKEEASSQVSNIEPTEVREQFVLPKPHNKLLNTRNSVSGRMAINFTNSPSNFSSQENKKQFEFADLDSKKTSESSLEVQDSSSCDDNGESNSIDVEEFDIEMTQNKQDGQDNINGDDIENIENEDDENSDNGKETEDITPSKEIQIMLRANKESKLNSTSKLPSGRGRGIIRLPNNNVGKPGFSRQYQKNHASVAKVSPSPTTEKNEQYSNSNFQALKQQHFNRREQSNNRNTYNSPQSYNQRPSNQNSRNFQKNFGENRNRKDFLSNKNGEHRTSSNDKNWRKANDQNRSHSNASWREDGEHARRDASRQRQTREQFENNRELNKARFKPTNHKRLNENAMASPQVKKDEYVFGIKPDICFKCQSKDHTSEACSIDNPFF